MHLVCDGSASGGDIMLKIPDRTSKKPNIATSSFADEYDEEYQESFYEDEWISEDRLPVRTSVFQSYVTSYHDPLIRYLGTVYKPVTNTQKDVIKGVADGITKYCNTPGFDKIDGYKLVGDKYVVNYDKITDGLIKYFSIVTFNGTIHIYDRYTSKFRENNKDIEKRINEILNNAFKHKAITSVITEIMNRIRSNTTLQEYPFNNMSNLIPCKNGIYDLISGDLKPHNPVYGFTYTINCEYNPYVDSHEMIEYLNQIVNSEDVVYLEQIGASCLLQESYKKAYLLYNKTGNNGKSLYLSVISELLGNDNVSNVSLQDLCNEKFKTAELVGKIANISADLPASYIPDISIFKALTGDDSILVEKKFQNPFKFKNKAPLIFGSNNVPGVSDKSQAFYNRIILIEFPHVFKVNPNKFAELTTEANKSALLNIFIERAKIVLKHGIQSADKDIKHIWEEESNISLKFINTNLVNDLEYCKYEDQYRWCLPYESVFTEYVKYCKTEDKKPHAQKKFDGILKNQGIIIKFVGGRGNQVKTLQGVKFADLEKYESVNFPHVDNLPFFNIPEPPESAQQNIPDCCKA